MSNSIQPDNSRRPADFRSVGPIHGSVPERQSVDTIQIREFVGLIVRGRWLIAGIVAAVTAMSAYWAFTAKPVYRAAGAIRLTNARQAIAGRLANEDRQGSVTSYGDPLKTQIQVLTSRSVASAVVDRVPVLLLKAIGFPPTTIDSVRVSEQAAAETLSVSFDKTGAVVTGARGTRRAAYGARIEYPDVQFTLTGPPASVDPKVGARIYVVPREQAISQLIGGLKATPRQESDVVDVEYTASDPYTAQRAVNAVMLAFQEASAKSSEKGSRQRREFIEGQLRENDSILTVAQTELASFRSRAQTFGAREKYTTEQSGLNGLDAQRAALAADRALLETSLSGVGRGRESSEAALRTLMSAPGITANPAVGQLYAQLTRYQTSRDSLTTGPWASAPTHPDVVRLDALIAGTQDQLVAAARSQVQSLTNKIALLDSQRSRGAATLSALPQTEADEARLSNREASIRKMSDQFREEYQRARIAEAVTAGEVEVVDMALLPGRAAGSGPFPKILVGALVGLVLGVGASFARENADTKIHRREEIERLLQVPALSVIPPVSKSVKNPGRRTEKAKEVAVPERGASNRTARSYTLVTADRVGSPDAEAYLTLRTNLLFSQVGRDLRRLIVTSPAPRDGKTSVSANLAACFATHGTRVLLVDCDLRRPSIHRVFGADNAIGLSDVIMGSTTLEAAIQRTEVPNLSLLLAGRQTQSPSQMIASPQMADLLATISEGYDLVILDTPPVLAVADAAMLATQTDGVLLVLRAGSTARDEAQTAASQILSVGATLVGVALNDPDNHVPQYSPYYYNYYTYYSTATA